MKHFDVPHCEGQKESCGLRRRVDIPERKNAICKGMGLATTDWINDPECVGSKDEG